jgi:hypothetical protein
MTGKHDLWLLGQRFDEAALTSTYGHYRAMLIARDGDLAAIEADLAHCWSKRHGSTNTGPTSGPPSPGAIRVYPRLRSWTPNSACVPVSGPFHLSTHGRKGPAERLSR